MLTADEVLAAVRVHADRVHDAVRRLGCAPDAAVQVVETSALDLVDAVAHHPGSVGDPIGWWFARARALARSAVGGGAGLDVDDDLPMGGGVLSNDASQVRVAEALEARPERERAALLLRDSYDLPATAVGTVLGLDADAAMEVVGAARLAFLPALLGGEAHSFANHAVDLGALARLGEGGQLAARDATARRHVQSCTRCGDVVDTQERARRLLSGLTVAALPDSEREGLLNRVEDRARALLPDAELTPELDEWDDEPARRYSWSLMALAVVLAVGVGIGIGIFVSRGSSVSPTASLGDVPLIGPAPVLSVPAFSQPAANPTVSPTTRVFLVTPSPTPSPTPTQTPTPTPTGPTEPLALSLVPSSGPNNTEMVVKGRGWTPGAFVTLKYLSQVGDQAGSTASVLADARGRFRTTLAAHDDQGLKGAHQVTADDGIHTDQATFNATD